MRALPLPVTLSDGATTYTKVRDQETLPDGRINVALYESQPRDDTHQFTPSAAFMEGLSEAPDMIPLMR